MQPDPWLCGTLNDNTITNRSHKNNVAIETYVPVKFEQELRESKFFEILPTLYRSQNHKMKQPLVSLKLTTREDITAAAYRSRNGINPSSRYEAEYSVAIWEDVLNHNVLYDAKDYTLHTYLDSKKMGPQGNAPGADLL